MVHPLRIVIFGPYKSGTTALFYKVVNSIDRPVRTIFENYSYKREENDISTWVVAKTILWYSESSPWTDYTSFLEFDKKIYLVRDPRDWVISGALFTIQDDPTIYENEKKVSKIITLLKKKEENPKSISLKTILEFILDLSETRSFKDTIIWMEKHFNWLCNIEEKIGPCCKVYYEKFIDNNLDYLEGYLGFKLSGTAQVAIDHNHVPRSKSYGNWKNWFTPEDVDFFRPLFFNYMRAHEYIDQWILSETPVVLPEQTSNYVLRTINKRLNEHNR